MKAHVCWFVIVTLDLAFVRIQWTFCGMSRMSNKSFILCCATGMLAHREWCCRSRLWQSEIKVFSVCVCVCPCPCAESNHQTSDLRSLVQQTKTGRFISTLSTKNVVGNWGQSQEQWKLSLRNMSVTTGNEGKSHQPWTSKSDKSCT